MKKLVRVMLLGAVLATVSAAFAASADLVFEEGYTYRDYRQDGLVAHWDAKNWLGSDIRAGNGTWRDLIHGRRLTFNTSAFSSELGPSRASGPAYWGVMNVGSQDFLLPREEGVTVELCIDVTRTTNVPLFFGSSETGIGIWKSYTNPGGWVFGYDGLEEGTRTAYTASYNRTWDKVPVVYTLSICYTNGHVDESHSYEGGNLIKAMTSKCTYKDLYTPGRDLRVLASYGTATSWDGVQLHAIRVYHGTLTKEQAEANRQIDIKRYGQSDFYADKRLFYAFTVKTGSVRVDGTAYPAGSYVYYRNDIAVPVESENAVIVPRKDGAAKIEIVSGKLTVETADAGAMPYVAALAIDASATLNVSA